MYDRVYQTGRVGRLLDNAAQNNLNSFPFKNKIKCEGKT